MHRIASFAVSSALLVNASIASEKIDKKYDTNGNGSISANELSVLARHIASPTLRAYDTNVDGRLEPFELEKIYRDAEDGLSNDAVLAVVSKIDAQMMDHGGEVPLSEISLPSMDDIDADLAEIGAQAKNDCDLKQRFFLRRDKIDMSIYNKKLGLLEKKGATVSYSDDLVTDSSVVAIDAATAFVLFRNACNLLGDDDNPENSFPTGWSLAAFSDFDGKIRSGDADAVSTARFGLDGQLELQGGLFRYQYLTAGLYAQTDFEGEGLAYGFEASWQPLDERIHLGIARANPWLEWYVDTIVRADIMRVADAGVMGLTGDTSYAWLGADLALTVNIAPSIFERRLFARAAAELYWDAVSKTKASLWSAGMTYNLDANGYTAIGLEYTYGESRSTLTHEEGVKLEMAVKY